MYHAYGERVRSLPVRYLGQYLREAVEAEIERRSWELYCGNVSAMMILSQLQGVPVPGYDEILRTMKGQRTAPQKTTHEQAQDAQDKAEKLIGLMLYQREVGTIG